MLNQVFLSYSRKDEEIMRSIAKFLRSQGIKVWVDNEKLIPGTPVWEDEVENAVRKAAAIVVILSPDSKGSEWVKREMALADQHHKRIFPVLVRGDENTSISLRLINRQFVDLRENMGSGLKSLSDALSFYISEFNSPIKTNPVDQAVAEPQVLREKPSPQAGAVERSDASKTTPKKQQPSETPARSKMFGWLTGGPKRLIPQLADETTRSRAAQELVRLDVDSIPPLLEALQTRDLDLLPIYQQILARIPSASHTLIKTLREAHPIIRARVADVLSIRKDPKTVPALLEALTGEYYTVRARAAIALGRIGDKQAIQPLLAALKDPEVDVRISACLGLGFFKDPSTFDDIGAVLLDDPKIEVRQAAAKALGNTRHHAALSYLMEALRDPFWWYEREVAAGDLLSAIEKMGNIAVGSLVDALNDKEGTVRKFAAFLLGNIGDARALEPLALALYDLHHDVGDVSANALAQFGQSSFEVLVESLEHPEMWVRIHSVDVLPKIKEPRVGLVLLEMLKDPEREVRKHVIEAMAQLKDKRTLPALQEIMANRGDREMHTLAKQAIELISNS